MLIERRLPVRYIFSKIKIDMVFVILVGVLIEVIMHYTFDPHQPSKGVLPVIPVNLAAFLGTAISLILSFKLSQSYQRWWEARKIWGAIVNDSRTLTRQVLTFGGKKGRKLANRIAHRQIAWCYCLGQSLRGLNWRVGTEGHLNKADDAEAESHSNRALVLLQQHGRDITTMAEKGIVTDFQRITMEGILTRLTDSMGKAERINNTVFPTAYRLYLHYFIYIFIFVLALALKDLHGPREVIVITVISIPFFLLEKTATFLQDPFQDKPTDTAVTAIARAIEINLLQLLEEDNVPKPLKPEGFYLN